MKKISEFFKRKSKVQTNNEHIIEEEKAQPMYTFSSIFPTEEIMERAMKIIHESDDTKKNEDELER